ncbi:MAG TPA: hypothetical protein VNL71_00245 [Chloroflexota bacterium]|nr:hypothetical protein [Chloroflexota bacterium]
MTFEQDPFSTPPHHPAHGPHAKHPNSRWRGTEAHARHRGVTTHARYAAPHSPASGHPHAKAVQAHAGAVHHPSAHHRQTRLHLKARAGSQRIEVGTIVSYNPTGNMALVRLIGAQTNQVGPIPLTQGISPALAVAGASCLVVLLDETNPADAAIVAIYNAPVAPWTQAGSVTLSLSTAQGSQTVDFALPFASALLGVTATSRDPDWVAGVSGENAGSFVLTLTRREGSSQAQAGMLNVPVAAGASTGAATVAFPTAFAVTRTVVGCAGSGSWAAGVPSFATTGCTLAVTGLGGAVGPATITVYWQATGDPAISTAVTVDWLAVGE